MAKLSHSEEYLGCINRVLHQMETQTIEDLVDILAARRSGRLFILGVGGSAANASHAVNDFRKLCELEAYTPTDNVAELTARTNDDGWETTYVEWLRMSRLNANDTLLVLSVGGGNRAQGISTNLNRAMAYAYQVGTVVLGIVGRDGGYTSRAAAVCVLIPSVFESLVTPLTESIQSVILHLLVSHPKLQINQAKWESTLS